MGNFNRGEKSWGHKGDHGGFKGGFRGGFGGNKKFGGGFGGPSRMFQAVCSDCGEECEVPFKPTGERPVLCNRCFAGSGRGPAGPKPEFRPKNEFRPQRSFDDKPKAANNEELKVQFEKLNAKLDRILKILAPVISPENKEAKEVKAEAAETEKPAKKAVKKAKAEVEKKAKPAAKKKPAKKA